MTSEQYSSLADLLNKSGIGEPHGFTDYTIEDVHQAALKYVEDNQKRPAQHSGLIPYPPFNNQIKWRNIDRSMALKEAGYKSLSDFCNKNSLGETIRFTDYTIEQVIEAARLEEAATGRRPQAGNKEKIQYGDLKDKVSWNAVSLVISKGRLQNKGYESLNDLLDQNKIGNPFTFTDYTTEQVTEAARLEFETTGQRPIKRKKGKVQYGALKNKTSWSAVETAIGIGHLKDEGYSSLYDLLNKNKIGEPKKFTDYTIEQVIEAARLEFETTGRRPTTKDKGKIQYGSLKDRVSWRAVHRAIKSRILKSERYKDLCDLLDKNNIGRGRKRTTQKSPKISKHHYINPTQEQSRIFNDLTM